MCFFVKYRSNKSISRKKNFWPKIKTVIIEKIKPFSDEESEEEVLPQRRRRAIPGNKWFFLGNNSIPQKK